RRLSWLGSISSSESYSQSRTCISSRLGIQVPSPCSDCLKSPPSVSRRSDAGQMLLPM
ncbi:unnamed protein product, partial [Ectocarpus fasciculatus]